MASCTALRSDVCAQCIGDTEKRRARVLPVFREPVDEGGIGTAEPTRKCAQVVFLSTADHSQHGSKPGSQHQSNWDEMNFVWAWTPLTWIAVPVAPAPWITPAPHTAVGRRRPCPAALPSDPPSRGPIRHIALTPATSCVTFIMENMPRKPYPPENNNAS